MSQQESLSGVSGGATGQSLFEWDGARWKCLDFGYYCVPPNFPPDPNSLPAGGTPGERCQFNCVPPVFEAGLESSTGQSLFEWDGRKWTCLDFGYYCVPPNFPPDPNSLPAGGTPGERCQFNCVPPVFEAKPGATARQARRPGSGAAARQEYARISTRNLIYHVYPNAANDVWRRNLWQLRRRMGVFNGRKVVAIAMGPGLVHPDQVQAALGWPGVEYLLVPNDPAVGHVASFARLLEAVRSKDPTEATFYAHTKGAANGSQDPQAIEYWRNAMYAALLDQPAQATAALQRYAAVGTCKSVHPRIATFPSKIPWGHWHFAGTFFWFRHDRVFGDFHWPFIPHDYYGVEAWLGGFLSPDEATSLLQPRPETDLTWTAYDRNIWTEPIADPPLLFDGTTPPGGPRISVVIPCKGRLAQLRHTLPYWLRQDVRPHEIIVVDYGCPERCGEWVRGTYPGIRVIPAVHNVDYFNNSRARNVGGVQATGDFVCFADADFIAPPDFLERVARQLQAGHQLVCIAHYDSGQLGLNGICTVSAELYRRLHGYDESNPTYGFDDTDFYRRCLGAGGSMGYLHNCQCMSHSDAERMRFYPDQDKAEAMRKAAIWVADTSRAVNPEGYGRT